LFIRNLTLNAKSATNVAGKSAIQYFTAYLDIGFRKQRNSQLFFWEQIPSSLFSPTGTGF